MKFPDFGKCQVRSLFLARGLKQEGYEPEVVYGIFTPSAPRRAWDERWQRGGVDFLHAWISIDGLYFDASAFQFGEKKRVWTRPADKRYRRLGHISLDTGEIFFTEGEIVLFDTYREENGCPTLTLSPAFI